MMKKNLCFGVLGAGPVVDDQIDLQYLDFEFVRKPSSAFRKLRVEWLCCRYAHGRVSSDEGKDSCRGDEQVRRAETAVIALSALAILTDKAFNLHRAIADDANFAAGLNSHGILDLNDVFVGTLLGVAIVDMFCGVGYHCGDVSS